MVNTITSLAFIASNNANKMSEKAKKKKWILYSAEKLCFHFLTCHKMGETLHF